MFLRNITIFLENIKVFFAAWECVKTKPRPYEPKDSIVHVLTHPPVCKVCTYASGYTYGGIRPHVYTYKSSLFLGYNHSLCRSQILVAIVYLLDYILGQFLECLTCDRVRIQRYRLTLISSFADTLYDRNLPQ